MAGEKETVKNQNLRELGCRCRAREQPMRAEANLKMGVRQGKKFKRLGWRWRVSSKRKSREGVSCNILCSRNLDHEAHELCQAGEVALLMC